MISLSLFHILAKMLPFLPYYRTNRSVTCGSQSMKLISHDFDNAIAFLTDIALFPSWDVVLGFFFPANPFCKAAFLFVLARVPGFAACTL